MISEYPKTPNDVPHLHRATHFPRTSLGPTTVQLPKVRPVKSSNGLGLLPRGLPVEGRREGRHSGWYCFHFGNSPPHLRHGFGGTGFSNW